MRTDSIQVDARVINDVTVSPDGRYVVTSKGQASPSFVVDLKQGTRSSLGLVDVVGQRDARRDLDPGVEEPLGEPERVRLGAQRPEQLAADRQELRPHAPATGQTRRPTRSARCAAWSSSTRTAPSPTASATTR